LAQSPNSNRRLLGRELRKARTSRGLKQDQVAAVLGCKQAKVARLEMTLVEIQPEELETMMNLYELPEVKRSRLREVHRRSDIPRALAGAPTRTEAYQMLMDLEPAASKILSWHSERLPGPLQSTAYMLKQLSWKREADSTFVTSLFGEREAREIVFTTDDPPDFHAILSGSALTRLPGGADPGLMLGQITRLQQLTQQHQHFHLQMLLNNRSPATAEADFTVLRFPPPTSDYVPAKDFAYIEFLGDALTKKDLTPFLEYWQELEDAALSIEDTKLYLDELSSDLVKQLRRANELTDVTLLPNADE
jgi:transcriptional regulator with XRE-family HTH domain